MTLGEAFDPRRNSLNAIRLTLAVAVIVSHSWPAGGYGDDPRWGDQSLGEWAVAGFFVVSGYLILSSRLSSRSIWDYLWRRFLRIYPGFFVCITVVALVIAPISVLIDGTGHYDWFSGFTYIMSNAGVYITQQGIDGTTTTAPYSGDWNAPLWTLAFEAFCYIWVGVLVSVLPKKWVGRALIAIIVVCMVGSFLVTLVGWGANSQQGRLLWLSGYFASGGVLFTYRDRIPLNAMMGIGSLLVLVSLATVGAFHILAGLPLAYALFYLAIKLPMSRFGSRNDISYGMYIWAFPLQQLLGILFPDHELTVFGFAALSIIATIPFALTSWLVVEKPAMRLKRLTDSSRRATRASFSAFSPHSAATDELGR
jgi:peptidoglycan/LPS O-acetylase OafA/YrhL